MTARKVGAALLLVAIGAALALGLSTALRDDDEPAQVRPTAKTTTTVARPDPRTSPEAAELYDLVTGFAELTIHARYRVQTTAQAGRPTTIEVWQKDGRFRQEATVEGDGQGAGRVAILNLPERVVLCQQPPAGTYTCGLVSETQRTAFDSLRANLLGSLEGQDVAVRDDTVEGRAVRCFTVAAAAESELCATPEGVLVRVASAEGSFDLVDFEREVDDAVFTPPAVPGAG